MRGLHEPLSAAVLARPLDQHAMLARALECRGTCTINMRGLPEPLSDAVLARPLDQHAMLAVSLKLASVVVTRQRSQGCCLTLFVLYQLLHSLI